MTTVGVPLTTPSTASWSDRSFCSEVPSLLQHHFDLLHLQSSLSIDVIRERGYWSAPDWKAIGGLGFRGTQKRPECFPALAIPQYDPTGEHVYTVMRWDHPRIDARGREVKYEQPAGVGLRLDVPPRCLAGLRDPERALWWTEGSKKADALASRGWIAVSTPGVEGWRSPTAIPDLFGIPFRGRMVYCAYDNDVLTKPAVRRAVKSFAAWMRQKGAAVYVIDWTKALGHA